MIVSDRFHKCAETKRMKDGSIQIHCKRGLWSVRGHDEDFVEREAIHYWQQYLSDGEYDTLLEPTGRSADNG